MSGERAGHESGRGHGPGGRLTPSEGDIIEVLQASGQWEWRRVHAVSGPFVWLKDREGWTSGALDIFVMHKVWRWPHLTALGIRGSVCCEEHGLIPATPSSPGPTEKPEVKP